MLFRSVQIFTWNVIRILMAMIDIEYRHAAEPPANAGEIRRKTVKEMHDYLYDLVCNMQMEDVSSKLIDTESPDENMVYINGKPIHEILKGLNIKMLESDDSCGSAPMVKFERPPTEWNTEIIEDIPDVIMKNAIAKVFADIYNNRIM